MVNKGSERWFEYFINAALIMVAIVSLFPILYVLSVSLTPYSEVLKNGGFVIIPSKITFEAYKILFDIPQFSSAFMVTIFVATVGTFINLLLSVLLAYPLSRKFLPGRSKVLLLIVFTMLFSGGLIPTYLMVKGTGLLNTIWALIIPQAISTFNLLIMKSFFENIPEEIVESARMDGTSEGGILLRFIMPLSLPVLITIGLFYMVHNWNVFFPAVFYITDQQLKPLQVVVRSLLLSSEMIDQSDLEVVLPTTTLQMASIIFASVPIVAIYPFLQKHLTKGMVLGSIKG